MCRDKEWREDQQQWLDDFLAVSEEDDMQFAILSLTWTSHKQAEPKWEV